MDICDEIFHRARQKALDFMPAKMNKPEKIILVGSFNFTEKKCWLEETV